MAAVIATDSNVVASAYASKRRVSLIKMAFSLGDFYGSRAPARRSSSLTRDFNLSLQSQRSSYLPNESLTQRSDLQVQFSHDELETPFDFYARVGSPKQIPLSGGTHTPKSASASFAAT